MTSDRFPRVGIFAVAPAIGGAERSIVYTVPHVSEGVELTVVSPNQQVLDEVGQVAPAVGLLRSAHPPTFLGRVRALRGVFAGLHPDVLHFVLPNPWAARDALLAACSLNIPVVVAEHLVLPPRRRRGRWLNRLVSWPVAATIVVGRRTGRQLTEWWAVPASSIRLVHNGIPAVPAEPVSFDHRPVIGCACRLEEQKGLDLLIDAVAQLPDVHLVLVGDGAQRDTLAAQAARQGLAERVHFTGWVDDARPFIAGFDLFVLASRDEAFPLTILEAMFCSTPVVATDVGSVAEAVDDGVTGLLVPTGDVAALRDAIRRLVDDPALRARLSSQALEVARQRFTAEQMAAGYEAVWREVTGRYPRGRWRWWPSHARRTGGRR